MTTDNVAHITSTTLDPYRLSTDLKSIVDRLSDISLLIPLSALNIRLLNV